MYGYSIVKMVRAAALLGLVVLQVAAAQDDMNCPETQPEDSSSCPENENSTFCEYFNGEVCPYDDRVSSTVCTCFSDAEWFCFVDECPICPVSEPTTGDPCAPEFTTGTCDYNQTFCSGLFLGGTTCLCNPSTSLFECTTGEIIDSCPSATCPAEEPDDFSFCDEPFGPGYFDGGVSDKCEYGEEICCPSTSECAPPTNCGCDIGGMVTFCEPPYIVCPDFCPEVPPTDSEACEIPVVSCQHGDCPTDPFSALTNCDCSLGEWFCYDACPICPYEQPSSGDSCSPEFTTEECGYNESFCSGIFTFGTTCQCNPSTSLFECTTSEESMDACPSAPCPAEEPDGFSFCDEPFGPGFFDGVSDTCEYGEEICCPSTSECFPPRNCGCNLDFSEVYCQDPFIFCPDFCPESAPMDFESCEMPLLNCQYGDCPTDPFYSLTNCDCDSGTWYCYDECPVCPFEQPASGDPCSPEFSTEECGYNQAYCSGVDFGGTTCLCNPSTSLFECTTGEIVDSCPSATCPAEEPDDFSFCDEPFGPGFFDGGDSDTCEYGEEICCPSTSECFPPANCGCDLEFSQVYCQDPFITCPDFCPESAPMDSEACEMPLFDCQYGDCPTEPFLALTNCDCSSGEWYCYDECPVCPYEQPSSGDSCSPEFTTEECGYNQAFFCSGVFLDGTTCQCNPDASVFECTTTKEPMDSCPSVPCPDQVPVDFEFCDEPFGPGYFDGVSDTCEYGEEICCPSTGECVLAIECGCDLAFSEVLCFEPSIACPEFCAEAPPETGDVCDVQRNLNCFYNFGECGFSPDISSYDCFCEDGFYFCFDFCDDESSPTASPVEDTGMGGGMMGMSGGMQGGMGGGMKGSKKGSSKSKERSLGATQYSRTTRGSRS